MSKHRFSLIVCTYLRPDSLLELLQSVAQQSLMPTEVLIIDASEDKATAQICAHFNLEMLYYHKVDKEHKGLTKQRNYGISKLGKNIDYVCFLDDDIVLEKDYFKNLISTYTIFPNALGVGGYITNEVEWSKSVKSTSPNWFYYDGFKRAEPLRFRIRKMLGLAPETEPGYISSFSHGRSVSFLPPSGSIYKVEQFMGGVSSYKRGVFEALNFSIYFEGYGLYEDVDFCIRLSELGELYVNTTAKCEHYHSPSGRPNQFIYGKMVVRNGWYVWRRKNLNPSLLDRIKWHLITGLQIILRCLGVLKNRGIIPTLSESLGRLYGWLTLVVDKPTIL